MMKKLCIIAIINIACVAFAFGRHMPESLDSQAPNDSQTPTSTDEALRKELDDMLVREINSVANTQDIDNTVSKKIADVASQHGNAEIDSRKIFKIWEQFTDVLLQNSDNPDGHSTGQTAKQNTGSHNHPMYDHSPNLLQKQNSDHEPPDPIKVSRIEQSTSGTSNCISNFHITVQTGNRNGAGFSTEYMGYHLHHITLTLGDGRVAQADLPSPAYRNELYTHRLNFQSNFFGGCVLPTDIVQVKLVAGGNDGWYIASISTSLDEVFELTNDPQFDKWLDGNEASEYPYDATQHILTLVHHPPTPTPVTPTPATPSPANNIDKPLCGYGTPVCECSEHASTCVLSLEVDEIMTFTSYQKYGVSPDDGIFVRGTHGVLYHIDEDSGKPVPLNKNSICGDTRNPNNCTEPLYVDGSTYRMVFAVNGLIPGPTIIVHENQDLIINVYNNMSTEGISIHWHGMHQRNSPWMDGVGQMTQCQIGPSSSYGYEFTASPSGSFWYHSHSGAQRTQGVFGTLIVKERPAKLARIKDILTHTLPWIDELRDLPGEHSISLLDWEHESSLDTFKQLNAGLGFYPKVDLNANPDACAKKYSPTFSMENGEVGAVPFYSGLLNGKGRHEDVPYSQTRLSVFTVEKGGYYRFRLIGSQGLFAYKFSIDGHKLTVIATDGYWITPEKNVDFIIIHSGERYDFIVEANQPVKNYWLRAETLEINPKGGPPYRSLGHSAEGILQYIEPGEDAEDIESTEYEGIKLSSPEIQCTETNGCYAINCPFYRFHPSYYTTCINVDQLQLLEETDSSELPDAYPSSDCPDNNCLHFLNFNFEGDRETSSINGRNFILPPVPPMTQLPDYEDQGIQCDLEADCNPFGLACKCTHIISAPYQKTVQLVFSAMGVYNNAHPIHLHGHTFFVVKVGYPQYDPETGFIDQRAGPICNGNVTSQWSRNDDIECGDLSSCGGSQCPVDDGCNPNRCTKPGWRNGVTPPLTITSRTVRKDSVMVPAGGYVVVNIISDNPGYWFLHCHIEVHQLEGMAMVLNEAPGQQQLFEIPPGLNNCGNYRAEYNKIQAKKERRRS